MPAFRILETGLATYGYSVANFNPAAAATDVWTLQGAATKKVQIRYLSIGGVAVAGRYVPVSLIRRSAANTGGTSTAPAIQKADSGDVAGSAVLTQYTASPSALGASAGTVYMASLPLVTANALQDRLVFPVNPVIFKPIQLNNSAEWLAVNFAAVATIATDKLDFQIWWTEQ